MRKLVGFFFSFSGNGWFPMVRAVKISWEKKWVTPCHCAAFAADALLKTWRELLILPKRWRESNGWLQNSPLSGIRCSRLILMADCKFWCTLLSKPLTGLCRSGLRAAREVMKPAWNTVENLYSPPFPHRMTMALCKSKLDCLCWLPNCQRQKNPKCLRRLQSGHRFGGECMHLLHCLVCLSVIIKASSELWHGAE